MKKGLFLSAILLAFLSACGNENEKENGSGNDQSEKQVLKIDASGEMDSMDTTVSTTNFGPMNNVFEGLMTYDLNGDLVPADAAEEPEVSADGLTYTFKIREDAQWSNGTPVTAQDYVYAWRRMVDPESAAGYAYMFTGILKNAEAINNGEEEVETLGAEAIDDKTLKVTLEKPTPYFLEVLTIPGYFPQNEDYVTEQGDKYGLNADNVIYNGPFELSDWNSAAGDSWKYVKNDAYWDKSTVQLDEIDVQVIKDVGTGINLYESGDLDTIQITGNFVTQYKDNPDFKTYDRAWIYYVEMNQDIPELKNENIRKALTMSIDRASFTENVLQNGSQPIAGHVPSGLAKNPDTSTDFREESGEVIPYDVEEAKDAWEKGLDELGTDNISFELITSDDEESRQLAEYIQSEWQKNLSGLAISIRQMPDNSRLDNVKKGNYQLATTYWLADFADPINFLERFDTEINRGNYSFADIDKLVEQSNTQYDDALARWQTMMEIEKTALSEHHVDAPIYQTADAYLEKPYVKDIHRPTFGSTSYKYASIDSEQK